jgi:hypothetical protein
VLLALLAAALARLRWRDLRLLGKLADCAAALPHAAWQPADAARVAAALVALDVRDAYPVARLLAVSAAAAVGRMPRAARPALAWALAALGVHAVPAEALLLPPRPAAAAAALDGSCSGDPSALLATAIALLPQAAQSAQLATAMPRRLLAPSAPAHDLLAALAASGVRFALHHDMPLAAAAEPGAPQASALRVPIAVQLPCGKRIALELTGRAAFSASEPLAPLGEALARWRVLAAAGWHVACIPWHEWEALGGPGERAAFIARLLTHVSSAMAQPGNAACMTCAPPRRGAELAVLRPVHVSCTSSS